MTWADIRTGFQIKFENTYLKTGIKTPAFSYLRDLRVLRGETKPNKTDMLRE